MSLQPIYTPDNLNDPAYQLRYTWSGWPSSAAFPEPPSDDAMAELQTAWQNDGLHRLETKWQSDMIQFTFSVKPQVAPVFFAARVKGRLQHALRTAGTPVKFSRKLAVRTIGDNTRDEAEGYIARQVQREPLADPKFKEFLCEFTVINPAVDLSEPTPSGSGRYWYNLHLVLVVQDRCRFVDRESLTKLRDGSLKIAEKKEYEISTLSVMPDHMHAALRGKHRALAGRERVGLHEQSGLCNEAEPHLAVQLLHRNIQRIQHERRSTAKRDGHVKQELNHRQE